MSEQTPSDLKFDLLLRGGRVIDPANHLDAILDVAISGGKIALVAPSIPSANAVKVLDVSGQIVTPGILDIHTHLYPVPAGPHSYVESVNPDAHLFAAGVTTAVDAGTTSWKHFLAFKESVLDRTKVRVLAYVNIACGGMLEADSEQTRADMQPHMAAALAMTFPELVVGIKTAHYWTAKPWDDLHAPWDSVDRAVQAAELCGLPVMVDFWPRPPERSYPDLILKKLRPGDIHTHVFAQQFPILAENRKVNRHMFEARERGVIFDLGHGAGSFWFRNAVPAFQDGFAPDSLSTDLHMGNIIGPVHSMLNTMSKYLAIGMPLPEVIYRSTVTPARHIRRPELGTLTPGAPADVAVFNLRAGEFAYTDCGKAKLRGTQKLECLLTLRDGQVVYDLNGLSMPDWEQAPAAYWQLPAPHA